MAVMETSYYRQRKNQEFWWWSCMKRSEGSQSLCAFPIIMVSHIYLLEKVPKEALLQVTLSLYNLLRIQLECLACGRWTHAI